MNALEEALISASRDLAKEYEEYAKAPWDEKAPLLDQVLATAHVIEKMCKALPSPKGVIHQGAIEAIVRGALKETIAAHGPITLAFIPSAFKRVSCALLGHLRQVSVERVMDEAGKAELERLRGEIKERDELIKKKQAEIKNLLGRLGVPWDGDKDPAKIEEIENEIGGIFYLTWTSEIKNEKPDRDPTPDEMKKWTSSAKANFLAAVNNLVKKAIEKYGK